MVELRRGGWGELLHLLTLISSTIVSLLTITTCLVLHLLKLVQVVSAIYLLSIAVA